MICAGVDEVGRGPICGPVLACAVILPDVHSIVGLADSKKLSDKKRQAIAQEIEIQAVDFAYGMASVEEIDEINILQASLLAMKRALEGLVKPFDKALIDGTHAPKIRWPNECIIKGDSKVQSISAASILAKVKRDGMMIELDAKYPGYGIAQHKGYPTKAHIEALNRLGVTPIYRTSFKPVAKLIRECEAL